jgi:hypothetical protein
MKLISRVKTIVAVSYGGGGDFSSGGVCALGFSQGLVISAKRCDPKIKCDITVTI